MTLTRTQLPMLEVTKAELWRDPHSHFAAARAQSPVARDEAGQLWMLSHESVNWLLHDPRFGVHDRAELYGNTSPVIRDWWASTIGAKNGDDHFRLRSLVSRVFAPRSADELRPHIATIAAALLDDAITNGDTSILGELPARVMAHILGIPEADRRAFTDASDHLGLFFGFDASDDEIAAKIEAAVVSLNTYFTGLVEERRGSDGDDLVCRLIRIEEDGDRLSTHEMVSMMTNLLFAGTDTVRNSTEIFCVLLAQHPDQHVLLRDEPALVPNAVEEFLRFEPVAMITGRTPLSDTVTYEGLEMRPGEVIIASLASADRDPARWPDPDRLDVRRDAVRTIDYGAGAHLCLGAALARVELQEMLNLMTQRCSSIELTSKPSWQPFRSLRKMVDARFTLIEAKG